MSTTMRSTQILKFATIEDMLANKPLPPVKKGRKEQKLEQLKARAGGKPYLLTKDSIGFELIHVNTGLVSKFDKLGNPRKKHDIRWIPYLTVRRYESPIFRLGVQIALESVI